MARSPGAALAHGDAHAVAVLGLGRFGAAVAAELIDSGIEVLGVDADGTAVQRLSGQLTHVVQADSTDEQALGQIGIGEFARAVIGMGTDVEASLLTASVVLDAGVGEVWAKAISEQHAKILSKLGVHHVVRPEYDMGRRVATLLRCRMLDYIEFGDGYAMGETSPPAAMVGQALDAGRLQQQFGVTVVAVKRRGAGFAESLPGTEIRADDLVIVSGTQQDVRRFSEQQ
ncbi:MAG: potassium channel family protein [Nakamurella sp.]